MGITCPWTGNAFIEKGPLPRGHRGSGPSLIQRWSARSHRCFVQYNTFVLLGVLTLAYQYPPLLHKPGPYYHYNAGARWPIPAQRLGYSALVIQSKELGGTPYCDDVWSRIVADHDSPPVTLAVVCTVEYIYNHMPSYSSASTSLQCESATSMPMSLAARSTSPLPTLSRSVVITVPTMIRKWYCLGLLGLTRKCLWVPPPRGLSCHRIASTGVWVLPSTSIILLLPKYVNIPTTV